MGGCVRADDNDLLSGLVVEGVACNEASVTKNLVALKVADLRGVISQTTPRHPTYRPANLRGRVARENLGAGRNPLVPAGFAGQPSSRLKRRPSGRGWPTRCP